MEKWNRANEEKKEPVSLLAKRAKDNSEVQLIRGEERITVVPSDSGLHDPAKNKGNQEIPVNFFEDPEKRKAYFAAKKIKSKADLNEKTKTQFQEFIASINALSSSGNSAKDEEAKEEDYYEESKKEIKEIENFVKEFRKEPKTIENGKKEEKMEEENPSMTSSKRSRMKKGIL